MRRTALLSLAIAVFVCAAPFGGAALACNGNYFHVDDFAGLAGGTYGYLVPIAGNQSLWCGVRATVSGYPSDGYGNNWSECWESCEFTIPPGVTDVYINYDACYHTLAGTASQDSAYFEAHDGVNWTVVRAYGGGPTCLSESIYLPAPLNGVIRFRFRFESDAAGSDQDAIYDTDGALIVDNIDITLGTQNVNFEDFECESVGAQQTIDGIWAAGAHPTCGPADTCVAFVNPHCDTLCAGAATEYIGFESFAAGDPVELPALVNPHLRIRTLANSYSIGCGAGSAHVVEWANNSPYWAWKGGTSLIHDCLSGSFAMADSNDCCRDYQFTFEPGYSANCFSIRMLDFGDFLPYSDPSHVVTLTGYNANNVAVDQDVLSFTASSPLTVTGDACGAIEGQPGNYVFRVGAPGMRRVVLTFDNSPDPRVGFDDIAFCGSISQVPCTPAPLGMKGWWKGDSTATDASGYANDGTLVGAADYATFPRVGVGAFHLNAAGDYVRVPDNPSLDFGTAAWPGFGNFSIDAWVFPVSVDGSRPIVSKFDPTVTSKGGPVGRGYEFFMANGKLVLTMYTASLGVSILDTSLQTVPANQWTHVAVTVDRDVSGSHTVTFYIDGTAVSSAGANVLLATNISNARDLLIGAAGVPPSRFFHGNLDEIEVFGRSLSPTEIHDIWAADFTGKCPTVDSLDCNNNGIPDKTDIATGNSTDLNGNDIPDECERVGCAVPSNDEVDFGVVAVGQTTTLEVLITNPCGDPYAGTIDAGCGPFAVIAGAGPYVLLPGDSLRVTVQFSPTGVGTTSCVLGAGVYPGITCVGVGDANVPVSAVAFEASWRGDRVVVAWRMSEESGAMGKPEFGVARREGAAGNFRALDAHVRSLGAARYAFDDADARAGEPYTYRVTTTVRGTTVEVFAVSISTPVPRFALYQNRPNPFRKATSIAFSLDRPTQVRLGVYDVSGRLVRTLVDGPLGAGVHRAAWDGRDAAGTPVASGVYLCRFRANGRALTRKMVIAR